METQLELNIEEKTSQEMQLFLMQKQIIEINESMGKVRRRLFFELGDMRKLYAELASENMRLRQTLIDLKHEKADWVYGQDDCLFKIKEA